jgi:SAM-dependent MidA family methyltransferase
LAALDHRLADTVPVDIVEICPAAAPIMGRIGGLIARHGGAALVIDYGGWQSRGDTFQALQDHRPTDPLAAPGMADLTAHVDFAALARAAAPARPSRMIEQGALLQRLGIDQRAARLAQSLTGAAQDQHLAAHRRLTDRAEMGSLFKALAVYPPHLLPPPGFDA